jgi:uncharacterized protein
MTTEQALAAGVVVLAGSAARGFTGFGGMLFTLPLLALVLPLKQAVPLLAALGLANGLWLTWSARKEVHWCEGRRLLLGAVPGAAAGLYLFHRASDEGLRGLLGVVVALLGLWLARQGERAPTAQWSRAWAPGAGVLGGVLAGLYGLSGPPAIFYLAGRPLDAGAFRATLLFYITVLDVIISSGYSAGGFLPGSLWLTALALLPAALLGSWLGERLQRRASEKLFLRIAGLSLAAMGLFMACRALLS